VILFISKSKIICTFAGGSSAFEMRISHQDWMLHMFWFLTFSDQKNTTNIMERVHTMTFQYLQLPK